MSLVNSLCHIWVHTKKKKNKRALSLGAKYELLIVIGVLELDLVLGGELSVGLMRSERVIAHTYTLDIDLGISICIRLAQLVAFKLRLDKIKKEVKGDILTERLKFDSNIVHEPDKGGWGNSETR
ncbi:hypothetical protein RND71_028527 [Anisodus tanguticus]|uniref:Uncharacterized protein n=1 Tax=Anisodus tanguticus TaxID=243964 RepID=A0AAE1RIK8_9SOLA|nr:hypothetical protein RND71_028527 [Anisodus tanguticus]